MAPPVTRLLDLADAVLAAIVGHWPAGCDDLPDRQFVCNGSIIWDGCEQLAVSVARTAAATEGDPATEGLVSTNAFVGQQFAAIDISLLRCVPDIVENEMAVPSVPSPADLEASASTILRDAQGVRNAVTAAQRAGELASCSGLVIEGWASAGPEGSMGGGMTRIRLSLI